jgi:hypothetical protein
MTQRGLALVVTICAALAGCEDGPAQTFQTAPKGAASHWNDGVTPGAVDKARQPFAADFSGGSNKQEICTGEQRAKRWAAMVQQPILPPTQAAGIDGVGGLDWKGLTVEQAEQVNCQSETMGDEFGDGSLVNAWGDNGEVWIKYDIANHNKIEWITLNMGYVGTLDFHSRDGKDKYQILLGTQFTKNKKPFQLNWSDDEKFAKAATEIADGLFATFAPELPAEDVASGSCIQNGHCTKTTFSNVAALRIWPLGLHLWVDNPTAPQPTPSKFTRIDLRLPRVMPYTLGTPELKLDAKGPTTSVAGLGQGKACTVALGMTWQDFLNDCVNVTGDADKDKIAYNKLTGNISHGSETYVFDTSGVDLDFQASALAPFDVVRDADRPVAADRAVSLTIDANTLGHFANDWSVDGKTQDFHGSGAVYFEFARLVQEEINHQLLLADPTAITHPLGDPDCLFPDDLTGFDPKTFQFAKNCTGFEGFVTAMPAVVTTTGLPASVDAVPANRIRLGPDAAQIIGSLGLKPGKPEVAFCMDATGDFANGGYAWCGVSDAYGLSGALWDTSFQRVRQVLGKGNVLNLPPELRDRRFYFRMYVLALLKYLMVAGDPSKLDLAQVPVDTNNLFFDSNGGQYDNAEYIDRRFVSATQAPLDFVVDADILNGTLFSYNFDRTLFRDEAAMYAAVTEKKGDPLGKENDLTLTNVFGSAVLAEAYQDHDKRTAYQCASADWQTADQYAKVEQDCEGELPPLDPSYVPDPQDKNAPPVLPLRENGKPILAPYKGAFVDRATAFSLGSTALTIEQTLPDLQAAKVRIETTQDPYDPSSTATTPLHVLVEPWAPPQPGVGFLWPINGQQDKLISSGVLDFSGITTSFNVYYQAADGTKLAADGTGPVAVVAVDSEDFLGEVFLCRDPQTGDLLRTRMYGSVQAIVDWIDDHPGVHDACGLVVRYSPYGNFPDYIISTAYGVRVGVTPGGGYGRVNDASMWVPGDY